MKKTGPSYGQTFFSSDNPSENIWHEPKKFSRIGQDFNNVISNFACSVTAIVNV